MSEVKVTCKLRDRRRERGISIRELEKKTGIGRGHISLYERGEKDMHVKTAAKFAVILECTLDDLFEITRV